MGQPIVIVAKGGIPVTESVRGIPATVATNGRGMPVTFVAKGGLPLSSGGGVVPSLTLDFANNIYERNGTPYASYSALLAAGGGSFSRASAGYALDGSQSFAVDVPRVTVEGLLLEGASTNLIIQSKLASGWGNENSVVTPNNDVAPDGTTTALRVKEDAAVTVTHGTFRNQNPTALAASRYVYSVFGKRAIGTRNLNMVLYDDAFNGVALGGIDLSNGNVNIASTVNGGWTAGLVSSKVAAQSYYRGASSFVPTAETSIWAFARMLSGTADQYTGDNTSAISVYGIQLELAAAGGYFLNNPSSLIATGAAAASRSADVNTITVPAGKTTATITYSDGTTQNVAVTGGASWNIAAVVAAHVAANNRAPIVRSVTFA